ncbi:MAG: MFS transporter [Deltaproteobacteria bacterium]|nr:MFS transporter [Deltaproteobacteria bacterium]
MNGGKRGPWQGDVSRYTLFFALTYFVQGAIDLTSGLANQPVQYLLKEQLHLSAAHTGFFFAVIGIGWTIKPLYGAISDFFPLAGWQRKSYLLLMSLLGMGSWLALSVLPPEYTTVLLLLTCCAATLAFCDVMIDALMVEAGRPFGLTGRFQAVQWASISLAFTLAQFAGGYLSAHAAPQAVFLLSAGFPLITAVATLALVQEPPRTMSAENVRATRIALWQAANSPTLWITAGFLFFWNFSPSLGTPLLYYQTDVLGFSKTFIGTLGAIGNAAGIVGALIFFRYFRFVNLERLLGIAVGLGVLSTLSFASLIGPKSAVGIFFVSGLLSQITHLAVLDLAARSCPARAEGTVFALLMACLNIGRTGSTFIGGWLYDHVGLTLLIGVSAGFTALCWGIVPWLRSAMREDSRSSRTA